jgi:hypothetical protein
MNTNAVAVTGLVIATLSFIGVLVIGGVVGYVVKALKKLFGI